MTSTAKSDELFMAEPIGLGSTSRVDAGRMEDVFTADIRDSVEVSSVKVDPFNTDEVLVRDAEVWEVRGDEVIG